MGPLEKFIEQVTHFEQDSREVSSGGLFFALKGERVDGHDFLEDAALRGAIGAVVHSSYKGNSFGLRLFYEEDVEKRLLELAKNKRQKANIVVGITGSVGKTTTKEMLAALTGFERTRKSYNSKVTVPLSMLNFKGDKWIVEMGMSRKGEMDHLVDLVRPDIGVLTKVTLAHAGFFSGLKEIEEEKLKIFKGVFFSVIGERYRDRVVGEKLVFSRRGRGDLNLRRGFLWEQDHRVKIELPFSESHFLEDFLAAAGAARVLGISLEMICEKARTIVLPKMRYEKVWKDGVLWIFDCYNANATSVIEGLKNLPKGRRIAVLGDMLELGKFSKSCHRKVGRVASSYVDKLFCIGEEAREIALSFGGGEHFMDIEALAKRIKEIEREGDVIYIKGSRGMHLERIRDLCLC